MMRKKRHFIWRAALLLLALTCAATSLSFSQSQARYRIEESFSNVATVYTILAWTGAFNTGANIPTGQWAFFVRGDNGGDGRNDASARGGLRGQVMGVYTGGTNFTSDTGSVGSTGGGAGGNCRRIHDNGHNVACGGGGGGGSGGGNNNRKGGYAGAWETQTMSGKTVPLYNGGYGAIAASRGNNGTQPEVGQTNGGPSNRCGGGGSTIGGQAGSKATTFATSAADPGSHLHGGRSGGTAVYNPAAGGAGWYGGGGGEGASAASNYSGSGGGGSSYTDPACSPVPADPGAPTSASSYYHWALHYFWSLIGSHDVILVYLGP